MKTAMQELIEKVEHAISYNVEGGLVEKYTWTELFNDMELALENEKRQTIDFSIGAYQDISRMKGVSENLISENKILFEEYYNQTYNL